MLWLTLLLILLFPGNLRADPFTFPGFGAESTALGGARVADEAGPASLAYNPAGLNTGQQQTMISYVWARPSLYVRQGENSELDQYLAAGPQGSSDPDYHLARFQRGVNKLKEHHAEAVPLIRGIYFGSVVPLALDQESAKTSLGFGVALPQGRLATIDLAGESAPHFVEFQDRNQAAAISAALGHDLPGGWSVGAGIVVDLIQADLGASVYIPVRFAITDILIGSDPLIPEAALQPFAKASVAPQVRPVAGVRWAPNEKFSFGLAYRDELHGRVDVTGKFVLAAGLESSAVLPWTIALNTHFQPRRLTAGAQWRPVETLRIETDLAWEQWSHYRPPLMGYRLHGVKNFARNALAAAGVLEAELLGSCLELGGAQMCLPNEQELLARIPDGIDVRYEFAGARDILVPRLGAGWRVAERVEVLAGYFYRPSIENSEGFTLTRVTTYEDLNGQDSTRREAVDINLLDNAQHGVSAGASWSYNTLTLSGSALFVHLVEKQIDKVESPVFFQDRSRADGKQVTDFGYPAYSYGGLVAGGMLQAALTF
jgi:hypothetical protein